MYVYLFVICFLSSHLLIKCNLSVNLLVHKSWIQVYVNAYVCICIKFLLLQIGFWNQVYILKLITLIYTRFILFWRAIFSSKGNILIIKYLNSQDFALLPHCHTNHCSYRITLFLKIFIKYFSAFCIMKRIRSSRVNPFLFTGMFSLNLHHQKML